MKRLWLLVRQNAGKAIPEVIANFILPYLIYRYAEAPMGDLRALLVSSLPPILWSLFELARNRRVDAVSMMVLAGILLSLLALIGGGSVRFLQLRENLVTGLIGAVFLGSAAIGKPLIYQLSRASMQRKSGAQAEAFAGMSQNAPFRRVMTIMTLVWGFGLIAETALACLLVFSMPIRDYLLVGPIVGYGTMGALILWTFWYGIRKQRLPWFG